jgi:rubrerythrin
MKTKNIKKASTVKKIKTALHEEKEANTDYMGDAKKVDPQTGKLFRHIASEERQHHRELKKRLKSLK